MATEFDEKFRAPRWLDNGVTVWATYRRERLHDGRVNVQWLRCVVTEAHGDCAYVESVVAEHPFQGLRWLDELRVKAGSPWTT